MKVIKNGNTITIGKSNHPDLQPIRKPLRKNPFNVKIGKNLRRTKHHRNYNQTTWGDFFNTN